MDTIGAYRQLYLFDQRGCGDSEDAPEKSYTLERIADDIEDVRANLGHQKVAVMGHSLGGVVAMTYALRWRRNLEALIVVDSPVRGWLGVVTSPSGWLTWVRALLLLRGKEGEMRFHLKYELGNKQKADEIRRGLTRPRRYDHARVRRLNMASFRPMDVRPVIVAGVPVLGIYGRQDRRFLADARYLKSVGARVEIIEGAGHWPYLEQPVEFHRLLGDFLQGRSR
jgi:pimeloyl-ACP methyl ester carboxylesterase